MRTLEVRIRRWFFEASGLAALSVLAGCSPDRPRGAGWNVSEADSSGVTIVSISGEREALPLWDLGDEPLLEISGDEPPFLGRVGEVEFLSDGRLVVEDNQTDELRVFHGGGFTLMGGPGEGPGEFQNLTELTVTKGDTVYTYDRRLYRITAFDSSGRFVRTVALTRNDGGFGTLAMDAWAIDSEHLLLHRLSPYDTTVAEPFPRRDERDVLLFGLNGEGEVISEPIRFPGGYSVEMEDGDGPAPFGNRPTITVGSGVVVYTSGIQYEVIVASPDLQPVRIIRWDGWREPLTEEEILEARDSVDLSFAEVREQRPDLADRLVGALFSPNLLPDLKPGVGTVLVDEVGRLWVSKFNPTTRLWDEEDAWHVLDENGHPLARVLLPPRARLAAVRSDRVAIVLRDTLDVEHLRVLELLRGGQGEAD